MPLDGSNIADELMQDLNLFEEEVRNNERYLMNRSSSNTAEVIPNNNNYQYGEVNAQDIDMQYMPHASTPSELNLKKNNVSPNGPILEK